MNLWGGQIASPNMHLRAKLSSVWTTQAVMEDNDDNQTLTQLDFHDNMVVIGSHESVF